MAQLPSPWLAASTSMDVSAAPLLGPQAQASRQKQRLLQLLKSASQSRFYQPHLAKQDLASLTLQDMPVVHKRELMDRFEDWVVDPKVELAPLQRFIRDPQQIGRPFLDRYTVWESSGSSGVPGIFIQDEAAMAVYDALEYLRRPNLRPWQRLMDPLGLGERTAFVGATNGHFASTVSIQRLLRLNPLLARSLHCISFLQPLAKLRDDLRTLSPTVLSTYPTAAVMLAGEQRAGRLHLNLREIWTGGEVLSPAMRHYVSEAFGCPITNCYGASEFLSLAFECCHGHLHLNSDWAILESVDQQGRPVAPGQAGFTTLLTNLANHVQPLIRYDLGDHITIHPEACACGSSLPRIEVVGRTDEAMMLGAPGAEPVYVLPLAITSVLEDVGLFDFQLEQQGPQDLLLRTGLRGHVDEEAAQRACQALSAFLTSQGVHGARIHGQCGEPGQMGASGKLPRVIALRT
jgi:phenylacetate-CoA ligase